MLPEIKLTVSQNDKILQTVAKSTEKEHLVNSLEEFQIEANATLTKMIEELGDIGEASSDFNLDDDDEEDGDDVKDNDKKQQSNSKEQNGESKCKKKKYG